MMLSHWISQSPAVRGEVVFIFCVYEEFGNHYIQKKFWKLAPKRKLLAKQYFEKCLSKHEKHHFWTNNEETLLSLWVTKFKLQNLSNKILITKFELQNLSYKVWVTKFELKNLSYKIWVTKFKLHKILSRKKKILSQKKLSQKNF